MAQTHLLDVAVSPLRASDGRAMKDLPHVTLDMAASEWEAIILLGRLALEEGCNPEGAEAALDKLDAEYRRECGLDDWGGVTT